MNKQLNENIPKLTLHSGAGNTVPNSREFLAYAETIQPDIIEVDVRVTSDGCAVLSHDEEAESGIGRLAIKREPIACLKKNCSELLELHEAVEFALTRNMLLDIDLKTTDALNSVFKTAESFDAFNSLFLSGCHPEDIALIKTRYPDLNMLMNTEGKALLSEKPEDYRNYCIKMFETAVKWNCLGLNVRYTDCRPEMIELALEYSMPVMLWTINKQPEMLPFFRKGIGSITTDRPDLFNQLKNNFGG